MKKKLMIDMDDCITDGTFRNQIEEFLGEKIEPTKTGYYLQNALGNKKEEFFNQGPLDMYQNAPLKKDAYEVIQKLNKKYELYIVSAYNIPDAPHQLGNHLKYKIEYIQKHLPFLTPDQIIFLNKKDLISFDIIIDDVVKNLKSGTTKILFDAYTNQMVDNQSLENQHIIRAKNWKEIESILL